MSVVYGHVNRHDGLIQLTSRPGEGTVFRILLPLSATEESVPTIPVSTHIRRTSDGPCDVLVVDDRLDVLNVVEKTLTAAGLRTFAYSSSTEALEYLAENSEVGCLVLDIMMPDIDGMAMLQEMAEKGLSIPVVVMSGYSSATPESFHQYPVVKSVVQKPFRQELILSSVLEAMSDQSRALIKGRN